MLGARGNTLTGTDGTGRIMLKNLNELDGTKLEDHSNTVEQCCSTRTLHATMLHKTPSAD